MTESTTRSWNEAQTRRLLEERARQLAIPAARASAADELELLVFAISGERYALETHAVSEVGVFADYTPVPGASAFLLGVTNLRGEILPVFDLRRLAGIPQRGLTDLSRLVVLGRAGRVELGLLADEVREVRRLPRTALYPPPEALASPLRALLQGVTRDAVLLLDGEKLLLDPRLSAAHGDSPEVAR